MSLDVPNFEKESLKIVVSKAVFCFHQSWKAVALNEIMIFKHEDTTFSAEEKITDDE